MIFKFIRQILLLFLLSFTTNISQKSSTKNKLLTRLSQVRETYKDQILRGLPALIEKDQIEVPATNKFKCALMKVEDNTSVSTLQSMTTAECIVTDIPSEDGTYVIHRLDVGNTKLRLGHFIHGFMDQAALDKAFPDQTDGIAKKIKDKMDPAQFLSMQKIFDSGNQVESIWAIKLDEAKYIPFLNANAFQDLTNINDFNIVPFLPIKEFDVDQIDDKTRTFASESALAEQFTEKQLGVKSKNQFISLDGASGFINNQMFFNNNTISLKLVLDNEFIILKNPGNSQTVEVIDTKKIYKCAVWQNIVPFAYNPKDESWCGVAFPYGSRDSMASISVKFLYIKKTSKSTECVKTARQFQNNIYKMCSKDNTTYYNLIQSKPEETVAAPSVAIAAQIETLAEDSQSTPTGNAILFNAAAEASALMNESLKSEFEGGLEKLVNLKSDKHIPTADKQKIRLERVLNSLMPSLEDLEADVQQINGVTKHETKYNPTFIDEKEQQELFIREVERRGENIHDLRFLNVNIKTIDNNVESIDKNTKNKDSLRVYQKKIFEKGAFLIHSATDKSLTTSETIESVRYWVKKLKESEIDSLKGRGDGIRLPESIQPSIKLQKVSQNGIENEAESTDELSYQWYDLEMDNSTKVTTKQLKSHGKRDGDTLTQKPGCCSVLNSSSSATTITICQKHMKIQKEENPPRQTDIFGIEASEEAYLEEYNVCEGEKPTVAKDPLAVKEEFNEDINVTMESGTLTVPGPTKGVVTTVQDGNVIKDDGTVKVVDNLATGETVVSKPGEEVKVKIDDGKVTETVTPQGETPKVQQIKAHSLDAKIQKKLKETEEQIKTEAKAKVDEVAKAEVAKAEANATGINAPAPTPSSPNTTPAATTNAAAADTTDEAAAAAATTAKTAAATANAATATNAAASAATVSSSSSSSSSSSTTSTSAPADPNAPLPPATPAAPASPNAAPTTPAVSGSTPASPAASPSAAPATPAAPGVTPTVPNATTTPPNPASTSPPSPGATPAPAPAPASAPVAPNAAAPTPPKSSETASPVALAGSGGTLKKPRTAKPAAPKPPSEPGAPEPAGGKSRKKKPGSRKEKFETPVGDLPIGDDNCYWRDLGYYNICIDKENKVTVHEKSGEDRNDFEHVQDAYREGNIVQIKFEDGNMLKHYLKEYETVKLYHDKDIVEHVFPDKSVIVDDKKKKLKSINNKQGIAATFDIEGNKFMDKEVKSHFKQGSDVIQVLEDGTKIIKKASGESVIMKEDGTVENIDKQGQAKFRQLNNGIRFKYGNSQTDNIYTLVQDSKLKHEFRMLKTSTLIRNKSQTKLFEQLPGKIRLEIAFQYGQIFKRRQIGEFEERCYDNYKGLRIGKSNKTQKCNCDQRQVLDLWSCEKATKRDAFKFTLQGLKKETMIDKFRILNNNKSVQDKDLELLKKLKT